MKKIIRTGDLCCKLCAERTADKLLLVNGIKSARADFKKSVILVDVKDDVKDEDITNIINDCGFTVERIEQRKGLFY